MITYDEFKKMEIKIAKILSAERVPNTDKLLKLEADLGSEKRELIAGVGAVYEPEQLVGKQVVVLANLEPKTIRGVTSHGMILCADSGGGPVLLGPEKEVPAGCGVK